MIKLLFLLMFLFLGHYSLRADEVPVDDQEFMNEVNSVKNPFEDGLPKPVVIAVPVINNTPPKRIVPKVEKVVPPPIVLPALVLQGVVVGDGTNQAIINDQNVTLLGFIEGAQLIAVQKQGVWLLFQGKKFFLKVD